MNSSLSLAVLFFRATFKYLLILVGFAFFFIKEKNLFCVFLWELSVEMHAIFVRHAIQKGRKEKKRKDAGFYRTEVCFVKYAAEEGSFCLQVLLVCFQKLWCLSKRRTHRFPFVWLLLLCRHITALYCLTHKDVNEQVFVSRLMCQRKNLCHVSLRGKAMKV